MSEIKQRRIIPYNSHEKECISLSGQVISLQVKLKNKNDINKIWENQKKCATKIINILNDRHIINVLVYGKTQTGKTGCMTSLIDQYVSSNIIPIDNIFILTGLSDKEWKKDTKFRMPESINTRIYHRTNLCKEFVEEITSKKNLLIIMDEIQIACQEEQTLYNTFRKCGFYDLNYLMDNDVKIIQFSGTPDGNFNDIAEWKCHSAIVKLEPGKGYTGIETFLDGRVFQFEQLEESKNVKKLFTVIKSRYKKPRYHLIRVPNKKKNRQEKVITNFMKIFGAEFLYNKDFLKEKKDDINELLTLKPIKHTFIFYCEILRCAKTQYKKFIGVSYERFIDSPNDSSIIQGSIGRLTGYDDNKTSICFTNIDSLVKYEKLWNNDMIFMEGLRWNTKTTIYNRKESITQSSGAFNSVKYINELRTNKVVKSDDYPIIEKFKGVDGQEKMRKFFNDNLKSKMPGKRGPNKKKEDDNGFYKGAIRKGPQILSTAEVEKEKRWGFSDSIKVRSYPCYSDVNDKNTLEWWLIYYDV